MSKPLDIQGITWMGWVLWGVLVLLQLELWSLILIPSSHQLDVTGLVSLMFSSAGNT